MLNCNRQVSSQYRTCDDFLISLRDIKKIGEGGTANVFRARFNERTIAIKVIPQKEATTNEIDISCIASLLSVGPRIIGWIYCNEHPPMSTSPGRYLYLTMEYLPFKFEEALIQGDPLCILFQILYQLYTLWNSGISHQDIHPRNIFIREDLIEREYQIDGATYSIVCPHIVLLGDFGRSVQGQDHDHDVYQLLELIRNMFYMIDNVETLEYHIMKEDLLGALSSPAFESLRQE